MCEQLVAYLGVIYQTNITLLAPVLPPVFFYFDFIIALAWY